MEWLAGTSVFARRLGEPFWYAGTVVRVDDDLVQILFDDGEEAAVLASHLLPRSLAPGSRVEVRLPIGRQYSPARVLRQQEGSVAVEYDDGDQETTSLGMIRFRAEDRKAPMPLPASPWIVGDRVWACWSGDHYWYPATVQETSGDRIHVLFDDGDRDHLHGASVIRLAIEANQRIQGRLGGGFFRPGTIVKVQGERIDICYDDGYRETTHVSMTRTSFGERSHPWKQGQRVLAHWPPELFFYPATIAAVKADAVRVAYDDGDRATLTPEQILPLIFTEGQTVFAKRGGGPYYYPARLIRRNGPKLCVEYEVGQSEWIGLHQVRVLPGG